MHASHGYTLRKTGRMLIWGSSRSQHGGGEANIKSFVTNDETEFRILTFWTY